MRTLRGVRASVGALLLALSFVPQFQGQTRALATSAGSAKSNTSSVEMQHGAKATRVIVKFRTSFASQVESQLPSSLRLTPETAASTEVAAFLGKHAARGMSPLFRNIVEVKKQRQVSATQIAREVAQRYSARALRLQTAFSPPDLSRIYVLELQNEPVDMQTVLNQLQADPSVEYAEVDQIFSVNSSPNDPYLSSYGSWGQAYDDLWGIKAISAPAAWSLATGTGIVVAVVDTGLDYTHVDISANVWTNPGEIAGNGFDDDGNGYIDDSRGWNFVNNTNDPRDDHGHGTHVAGTIAAVGNNGIGVIGVAWQAKIMPLKALDSAGIGYESNLSNAIVYAADNGADVISNSWGAWGTSQVITDAVNYAYNLGAVVVAAAGNSGDDARNYSPANITCVITVAATTPTGTLATFSNFGPKIDVSAPGVDILSLRAAGTSMGTPVGTGYTRASGTSMATPHVTGAAALVLSQHPTYSNEQVRAVLRASANDLGDSGYDLKYGYGGLNAVSALGVTSPLEAKIRGVQYGSTPLSPISILGIAQGAGFARYTLEYGAGASPTSWTQFQSTVTPTSGLLGQFDPSAVSDNIYTIRLTVYNGLGSAFVDRAQLSVNTLAIISPVPSPYLTTATTYKPGKLISVLGTAVAAGFQNFQVEWANGANPTTGWQTAGVTLTSGGLSPLVNAQLATWDTSTITTAGYYTIRLSATGNQVTRISTLVYLEPDLISTGWPVWLDQGPYFNSGVIPAVNADGTYRLAVASPNNGTTMGALWIIGLDGSTQKTPLSSYGSFHQPSAADIDGVPGQELLLPDSDRVRVFHEADTPSTFVPSMSVDLTKHPMVVEDLDGDSHLETIAIGNNYADSTAEIFAWRPDGTLLNSNFPIAISDKNSLSSWYNHVRLLVGDFDGDGKKEIVVQEGLSSTTYTLRIFSNDGTPRSWGVPVLTGIPVAMIAADLDHNGKLDTILVSYSGTQATLHVFQPDGSERTGWPLSLSNANQYSQAFLAVGDLNRDGHEEIVFSHETELYLFKTDGTAFSNAWPLRTGKVGYGAVVIGDVDGDGYAEIVTTRNDLVNSTYLDDKLLAIKSDGAIARSWQLTGMNGYSLYDYPAPAIGDFDQSGTTEIAVAYEVTGPGGLIPGIVTILSTGVPFNSAANDWPFLLHDVRNTGILRRPLATTTGLLSLANPSVAGRPVPLTATVTPNPPVTGIPTGSVAFYDGAESLGTGTLDSYGQAVLHVSSLNVGTHDITAAYGGDDSYAPSTSLAVLETIVEHDPVPVLSFISPASATSGTGAFTLTANGSNLSVDSKIVWNGTQLPTTFVSSTQLTAAVPAALVASADRVPVMVSSPAPGGGPSISLPFTINPATGSLPPMISGLSISDTANTGGAYSMAVSGANFLSGASVLWNGSSRTTSFVNGGELATLLTTADVTTVGVYGVTVSNPGGVLSQPYEYAVDTPPGVAGDFKVNIGNSALRMMRGSSITVPITFGELSPDAKVSVRCANLPHGISCSYGSGVMTIAASPATAGGTYHALVIFTARQRIVAVTQHQRLFGWSALALLPFGFVLAAPTRRKCTRLALLVLTLLILAGIGCGTHNSTSSTTSSMTTSQKSLRITLSVE